MAASKQGTKVLDRVMRSRRRDGVPRGPLQTGQGRVPTPGKPDKNPELAFLDYQHPIYQAWVERWEKNEARLAGGDEAVDELRKFVWEQDTGPDGAYEKRKDEAIYTNFPDIYATSITSHLTRFAPRPDQGFSIPALGQITSRNAKPSRAEQIWFSIDNPSGAGSEWNPWWMGAVKRASATGHRWIFIDTPADTPANREEERLYGLRPYAVEFSPLDVPNWYINPRGVIEFVVIRPGDDDPTMENGGFAVKNPNNRPYLLLVREGVTRLGVRFQEGGWWRFDPNRDELDHQNWDDTLGEIPISLLFYEKHKGTRNRPAISRPGVTELGQAAIAFMNQTSSANYNSWNAGGGVDYLAGIDEEGFELVQDQERLGSRRIPLPPHGETDAVPSVTSSAMGAVQAGVFTEREVSIWNAAANLGVIEASAPVQASGSAAEAGFKANQMPRVVWVAQNLAECQNNTIRYFELRYGVMKPTGQAVWPMKFDLVEIVDRVRKFFEIERLAGIRSKTVDARAMVQAAEDAGMFSSPADRATFMTEYQTSATRRDKIEQAQAAQAMLAPMQAAGPQTKQANRLALNKATRTRGKGGRPGPKQPPVGKSAPGVKR